MSIPLPFATLAPMRNVILRLTGFLLVLPVLLMADTTGRTEQAPGLWKAVFETADGSVTAHFPDDLRAGDTLSGVVVADPAGDSEKKRRKNMDRLDGMVVEVEGQKHPANREQARWTVPPPATGTMVVKLLDPKGRELGRTAIPLKPAPGPTAPHEYASMPGVQEDVTHTVLNLKPVGVKSPAPGDYRLPRLGQTGRNAVLTGPFDGRLDTTTVLLNGKPVRLLAESPRQLVIQSPAEGAGEGTLRLQEGNVVSEGPYRNVEVLLAAPTTRLTKGETTTLSIRVNGLEGLSEAIPLELRKSGVVSIQGGDGQHFTIKPSDVGSGGSYHCERTLTGLEAGAFNVIATVTVPKPGPPDDTASPESSGPPPGSTPDKLCGPDITNALKSTLQGLEARFSQHTEQEKSDLCAVLRSPLEAAANWDVVDLHTPVWVNLGPYSPPCARPAPPCGDTVAVKGNCYKAQSVNYAAFGAMHRLCADHDIAAQEKIWRGLTPDFNHERKVYEFWLAMAMAVQLWKGPLISREGYLHLTRGEWPSAAPNFGGSWNWANAGYFGWHKGSVSAPPSEMDCPAVCPVPCAITVFQVQWGSDGDFLGPLGFK